MKHDLHTLREFLSYDPVTGIFRWIKSYGKKGASAVGEIAGCVQPCGYRQIRFRRVLYYAHRLAWWFVHDVMPKGRLDHENRDKDDNRIRNLRPATAQQNVVNAGPRNGRRFKGAYYRKKVGKWQAAICVGGKFMSLGFFDDEEKAASAYDVAAQSLHGSYAKLNFDLRG